LYTKVHTTGLLHYNTFQFNIHISKIPYFLKQKKFGKRRLFFTEHTANSKLILTKHCLEWGKRIISCYHLCNLLRSRWFSFGSKDFVNYRTKNL